MGNKSAKINARIEPKLKEIAESIIKELGLTVTEVLTLLYKQIALYNGIPFELRIPNAETKKVFEDSDTGKNIIRCKDAEDLFDQLGL